LIIGDIDHKVSPRESGMIQAYYARDGGSNPSGSTFISKKMKMKMKKQMRMKMNMKKMKMRKQTREKMKMNMKKIKIRKQTREKMKMKKQTKWIRPAPRASGLRPQLDSVVFPLHMRSVK
jgi:hypothetical protein